MAGPYPYPPVPGEEVFARITGKREYGSRYNASPMGAASAGQSSRAGREDMYGMGADTRWFDQLWDNPPEVEDIEGAVGMMGKTAKGQVGEAFEQLLSEGPYQAVSIPDYYGTWAGSANEFYNDKADRYLNPTQYKFGGRGDGIPADMDIDPRDIDPTTAATRDEYFQMEDWKKRLTVADVSSVGKWPAPITDAPTTTTNPKRPRTVAAGFDGYRKVLTVIFRDGSYYNYYGVSNNEWGGFLSSKSKGRYIRLHLDGKVRGYADVAAMPATYRDLLYRVSRTAQAIRGGKKR